VGWILTGIVMLFAGIGMLIACIRMQLLRADPDLGVNHWRIPGLVLGVAGLGLVLIAIVLFVK
jgi:hypothetical protein